MSIGANRFPGDCRCRRDHGMELGQSRQSLHALTRRCFGGLVRLLFTLLLVMIAGCNKTEPDSVNGALRKFNAKDYRGCIAELDRIVAANPTDVFAYGTRAF